MTSYRTVFWLNSLSFLLVVALIVYAKFWGQSAGLLFLPPFFSPDPDVGFLTHTFQLLCAIPAIVCAFSFGLLQRIRPRCQENIFILCSALLTGGFLLNEIFRIHIILLYSGIPKLITILVYGMIAGVYGLAFKRIIQSTPYLLLLTGIGLLFIAIAVDSLNLSSPTIASLLEGIPKLFSEINIALYYWYVCYQQVLQHKNSELRS
jgi:hypothetical protein